MAASAERRERELPAPRDRSTKTSLQGLPSHQRDWDSATARLALEGCSEIVRKADRGALHTRILASPGRDRGGRRLKPPGSGAPWGPRAIAPRHRNRPNGPMGDLTAPSTAGSISPSNRNDARTGVATPVMVLSSIPMSPSNGPPPVIRRTTAGAIMELGGSLIADRSGDAPPYHCHLSGLTPEQLDSILEPPERNPVPVHRRWMPR